MISAIVPACALKSRKKGGSWGTVASNLTPEYRVVSGWRRLDQEAYPALKEVYGEVTQEILDRYKWGAFWDAPLRVPGDEVAHGNSTPPPNGIPGTNQPGLPRKAEEIKRLLDRGVLVTVNSDDPAYFPGYVTENLLALQEAVALSRADVIQLQRNAIEIAWLPAASKGVLSAELDRYVAASDP